MTVRETLDDADATTSHGIIKLAGEIADLLGVEYLTGLALAESGWRP